MAQVDRALGQQAPLSTLRTVRRLAGLAAIGVLSGPIAGAIAGAVVGGIGSRLIMRLLAAVNPDANGLVTENGNVAGRITFDGTLGLVFFGALFFGAFGGVLYIVVRRWIPLRGAAKGLAYGIFLYALFGSTVIDGGNKDFALFGPTLLSVPLFSLLFPLYGLAVSAMADRVNSYVPTVLYQKSLTYLGYAALVAVGTLGLIGTVGSLNSIF